MDLRKVKKLIELVEESGIAELEVASGDESIRIAMNRGVARVAESEAVVVAPAGSQGQAGQAFAPSGPLEEIKAPMAGVFYQAPNPDAEPFVQVGQRIQPGDVVCIIESMKMMNKITAVRGGTIEEVLIANGDAIATGTPLFKIS